MKSFKIQKLFGRFDYEFSLSPDGLTILTGPNGYGKSTILHCIEALGNGEQGIAFLSTLEFKNISIRFEDESEVIISKNDQKISINGNSIPIDTFKIKKEVSYVELKNLKSRLYFTDQTDIEYALEERVVRKSKNQNEALKKFKIEMHKLNSKVGHIYFIQEQRLIKRNDNQKPIVNVIDQLPEKFKNLINNTLSNYSTKANELDSTYPIRLFNTEGGITNNEFEKKIKIMNEKFDKLNKYNLSIMRKLDDVIFKNDDAKALKIYFDDFEEKYAVYEDFIKKLDIFTNIINDRLSFKRIIISKEHGIAIVDSENAKKNIPLNKLSSGEKQVIVLFYELIFETPEKQLLLIDEPEISLHISWQKKFMDDLLEINNYKSLHVIVATHSPQIINNHWERQVDLGTLYGIQLDKTKYD